jgi:hypothetical protein
LANDPHTGIPAVYGPIVPDRYANDQGPYNPQIINANPTQSVPGPASVQNLGYWSDTRKRLMFTNRVGGTFPAPYSNGEYQWGNPNVPAARALWQTPVFDLRPDLKASAGVDPSIAFPIMRPYGSGSLLSAFVENDGGVLGSLSNLIVPFLEFYAVGFGHPVDPQQVAPLSLRRNITSAVWSGASGAAILSFVPPSNPIRYWAVAIVVDLLDDDAGAAPPIPSTLSIWGVLQ